MGRIGLSILSQIGIRLEPRSEASVSQSGTHTTFEVNSLFSLKPFFLYKILGLSENGSIRKEITCDTFIRIKNKPCLFELKKNYEF